MKKPHALAALLTASALIAGCGKSNADDTKAKAPDTDPAAPAVVCNGETLTFGDIDTMVESQIDNLIAQGRLGMEEEGKAQAREFFRSRAAQNFIQKTLVLQEAKRRGIAVTDEDLAEEMARIEFQAQSQGMTLDELFATAKMPKEAVMREINESITFRKFVDGLKAGIAVTEAEITAEKDKVGMALAKDGGTVTASHILVSADTEDAEAKINDIKKQLDEGADFAELAKTHSACPSSERGGDLGPFRRGQMVKEFSDAAFALQPGQVSGIVTTKFGHHIIKVTAVTRDEMPSDEQITDQVKQAKLETIAQELFGRLHKEAKIENNIPGLDLAPAAAPHEHGEDCDH